VAKTEMDTDDVTAMTKEQHMTVSETSQNRLAVLIDATITTLDHRGAPFRGRQVRRRKREACLWRLDDTKPERMEVGPA